MTLYIAAECEYEGAPAIAMCCDTRAQTGDISQPGLLVGVDDIHKMKIVGKATIMLAGSFPKATELATACKSAIRGFLSDSRPEVDFDMAVDAFLTQLRNSAAKKKMEAIRNFVMSNVGVEHEQFLKLPSDNYIDVWTGIKRINLGADLLINYVGHESTIVRLDRYGETHWETNYGATGDGAEIARAFLCLQPWYEGKGKHQYLMGRVPLTECLYRICEAKCAAHIANPSSVGESTSFQVLAKRGRWAISGEMWKVMDDLFHEKHCVPDVATRIAKLGSVLNVFQPFEQGVPGDVEPPPE